MFRDFTPPTTPATVNLFEQDELNSLQQRMQDMKAVATYNQNQTEEKTESDENMCKICYENTMDVLLYPCGHVVICAGCAQKLSDCPVCRKAITDIVKIFKS